MSIEYFTSPDGGVAAPPSGVSLKADHVVVSDRLDIEVGFAQVRGSLHALRQLLGTGRGTECDLEDLSYLIEMLAEKIDVITDQVMPHLGVER